MITNIVFVIKVLESQFHAISVHPIFYLDSDFVWSYMWLIYGISGFIGAAVVIYLTYKFIAETLHYLCPSRFMPDTPARPRKLSFPKRKILSTIENQSAFE